MPDVYCFGHVSTGTIVRLKARYPAPDGYAEIAETLENHCGEAAGSSMVLARLGATVSLEGNWIGDNPECRRTLAFLQSRGIDCAGLVVKPGYRGATEIVISDGGSRTVFGRYVDLLFTTPQWNPPTTSRIRAAKIVCVDPAFGDTTLAVARTAKAANLPVVTCDARADAPLHALADVNIVSNELIHREYPDAAKSPAAREKLFADYLQRSSGLVVFTSGSQPLWYARGGEPANARRELAAFKVTVVDSAGAGDSFRGGLIYGLLRGWSDERSLQFASAVAALVCTTAPGCVASPTLAEVRAFLADRGVALPDW
ncbi:carbohydrate kinase family protein [Opitutus terrae]|uniref:PfkB domain protein n=1 Tax=Opitutus terrae (strain DSM 11246 / JCM 15787 / PB90-1) TaxID=452637 RepID=B1ZQI4_OPITP|nr:carbohydrate kinase family protein [Opitutus terrae]ACB75593.1 PfkB domain protein [Opitutus terrae PB90-1]